MKLATQQVEWKWVGKEETNGEPPKKKMDRKRKKECARKKGMYRKWKLQCVSMGVICSFE